MPGHNPIHVQESNLQDSAGGKPSYNLRTLTRALQYARRAWPVYGLQVLFHSATLHSSLGMLWLNSCRLAL